MYGTVCRYGTCTVHVVWPSSRPFRLRFVRSRRQHAADSHLARRGWEVRGPFCLPPRRADLLCRSWARPNPTHMDPCRRNRIIQLLILRDVCMYVPSTSGLLIASCRKSVLSLCFPSVTSNGIGFINRIQGQRAICGGLGTHGYGIPFDFQLFQHVRE